MDESRDGMGNYLIERAIDEITSQQWPALGPLSDWRRNRSLRARPRLLRKRMSRWSLARFRLWQIGPHLTKLGRTLEQPSLAFLADIGRRGLVAQIIYHLASHSGRFSC